MKIKNIISASSAIVSRNPNLSQIYRRTRVIRMGLVGLTAILALQNCGEDSSPYSGNCNVDAADYCLEYPAGIPTPSFESACSAATGTWTADTGCSATGLTEKCAVTSSGVTVTTYYYTPLFTLELATAACTTASGTFTAPTR